MAMIDYVEKKLPDILATVRRGDDRDAVAGQLLDEGYFARARNDQLQRVLSFAEEQNAIERAERSGMTSLED